MQIMLQKWSKYGCNYHHEKRHLISRKGTYYFSIAVPKNCQESVGKTEITQSLKTTEAVEAVALAKQLTDEWKLKFKDKDW